MYLSLIGIPSRFRLIIINSIGLTTAKTMRMKKSICTSRATPRTHDGKLRGTITKKSNSPTILEIAAADKATLPTEELFMPRSIKSLAISEKGVRLSISNIVLYSVGLSCLLSADLDL